MSQPGTPGRSPRQYAEEYVREDIGLVEQPARMPLVRAALLAVLAAVAALAPQAARAHGGEQHEAAPLSPVVQELSAPCAPGGSGHVCGCGNFSLCSPRSQAAIVSVFVSHVAAPGPSARVASHPPAPPFGRPDLSPPSPRDPPCFL
jgi:hypothetical protein